MGTKIVMSQTNPVARRRGTLAKARPVLPVPWADIAPWVNCCLPLCRV